MYSAELLPALSARLAVFLVLEELDDVLLVLLVEKALVHVLDVVRLLGANVLDDEFFRDEELRTQRAPESLLVVFDYARLDPLCSRPSSSAELSRFDGCFLDAHLLASF